MSPPAASALAAMTIVCSVDTFAIMSRELILELQGITKSFPGVMALDHVDLQLERGTVHGLVGENGAGKSTLISILNGIYQPDAGTIRLDGNVTAIPNPLAADALGMSFIHQEPTLFPELSVAENLFAGKLAHLRGIVSHADMVRSATNLLARMNIAIDPSTPVRNLRLAEAQIVEILRAVSKAVRILVMDEPTSSLTEAEKLSLFNLIASLKAQGVTIIYVSHFLDEVLAISDRITVMKDGQKVGTYPTAEITKADLIEKMVGKPLTSSAPVHPLAVQPIEGTATGVSPVTAAVAASTEVVLSVTGLSYKSILSDITFDIRRGEILGICGLLGAGKTELAQALFGLVPPTRGKIEMHNRTVRIRNPGDAIHNGIGFVTESRLTEGIIPFMSVKENSSITIWDQLAHMFGIIDRRKQEEVVRKMVRELNVRTAGLEQPIMYLSGGNQQKVVLSKWLLRGPSVLILDEPTRGIDVGAKREFYRILQELAAGGTAILLISSEIDEVFDLSDRILIMQDGRIRREVGRGAMSRNELLAAVTSSDAVLKPNTAVPSRTDQRLH